MVSVPFVPQRNNWKYRQKNEFRTEFVWCSFSQSDPYSCSFLMIMNLQISWEVWEKKKILHSKAHFPPVGSISSKHGGAFTNQEGSEKLIYTNAVWGNLIFSKCRKAYKLSAINYITTRRSFVLVTEMKCHFQSKFEPNETFICQSEKTWKCPLSC